MPKCPFCKGQIGEDLLRFGGHCPHCLNEIPGEETATDPGAEARAREDAEMRVAAARQRRRNQVLGAVAVGLLISVPIAAYALREKPQPLVLDATEIYIAPPSAHQNAAGEKMAVADAEKAKEAAKKAQQHHNSAASLAALPTSAGSEPAPAAPTAAPDPEAPPTLRPDGTIDPNLASLSRLGPAFSAMPNLPGVELSSDAEITSMVKTFLKVTGQKQLQQCYESELKENPGLSGRWNATFVIEKEGNVKSASAEGQNAHDHDLEACLVAKMEKWTFSPINHSVEITNPLVFQGG